MGGVNVGGSPRLHSHCQAILANKASGEAMRKVSWKLQLRGNRGDGQYGYGSRHAVRGTQDRRYKKK